MLRLLCTPITRQFPYIILVYSKCDWIGITSLVGGGGTQWHLPRTHCLIRFKWQNQKLETFFLFLRLSGKVCDTSNIAAAISCNNLVFSVWNEDAIWMLTVIQFSKPFPVGIYGPGKLISKIQFSVFSSFLWQWFRLSGTQSNVLLCRMLIWLTRLKIEWRRQSHFRLTKKMKMNTKWKLKIKRRQTRRNRMCVCSANFSNSVVLIDDFFILIFL